MKALADEHFRYGEGVAGVSGDLVPGIWKRSAMAFAALAAVATLALGWSALQGVFQVIEHTVNA